MKLTTKDGEVYELHNEYLSNKQMALPEIRITEKLGFNELSRGEVAYSFRMSYHTDQVWRAFLSFPKLAKRFGNVLRSRKLCFLCNLSNSR